MKVLSKGSYAYPCPYIRSFRFNLRDLMQVQIMNKVLNNHSKGPCAYGHPYIRAFRPLLEAIPQVPFQEFYSLYSIFLSGFSAGPSSTCPSKENLEPWHGQSQERSPLFHSSSQPTCVQVVSTICRFPSVSL